MKNPDMSSACPFRPDAAAIGKVKKEVSAVAEIQQALEAKHPDMKFPDRVAHQYQIAGSRVTLDVSPRLPVELDGVGLFQPGASHSGIGRISTGMGTPHLETNPDFLGLMLAFETDQRCRVDFLGINHPAAPTEDHLQFINVLHATAAAAGEELPLLGEWGEYDLGNLLSEQTAFALELKNRCGWLQAGKHLAHILKQTSRTVFSSTAYQRYWTGVVEVSEQLGKFIFEPVIDNNKRPAFRPGERYLSEDWKARQAASDLAFNVYWLSYKDDKSTPLDDLTEPWDQQHKAKVAQATFPRNTPDNEDDSLYAHLAAEMGANPGNWIRNKNNDVEHPATEFTLARKLAYEVSQAGRQAIAPSLYSDLLQNGTFSQPLREELQRRRKVKQDAGHIDHAPDQAI